MKLKKKFKFIVEKTETGFSAFSEETPVYTTGKNITELQNNIIEAIELAFDATQTKFSKENIDTAEPSGFSAVLSNKWYVDEIYDAIIVRPINWISSFLSRVVDNKLIDGLVNGVGKGVQFSARQLRLLQSGQVGSYILIMMIAIILFFIFQLFWKL